VRLLRSARLWFGIAGVLAVVVMVVDGPVGGGVAVAAGAAFLVGCFRGLVGKKVDDRPAFMEWFGGN
jgi:hypothetical protein